MGKSDIANRDARAPDMTTATANCLGTTHTHTHNTVYVTRGTHNRNTALYLRTLISIVLRIDRVRKPDEKEIPVCAIVYACVCVCVPVLLYSKRDFDRPSEKDASGEAQKQYAPVWTERMHFHLVLSRRVVSHLHTQRARGRDRVRKMRHCSMVATESEV